jgi:hypothetical protein
MTFFRIGSERRLRLLTIPVVVAASWSSPCAAQSSSQALAEALFQEGRTLMERAEYPSACAKLGESYRLDPATGTLLNLALCHEKEGKTATAWAEFQSALGRVRREGREERVKFARESLERLEPRLPRVLVKVDDAAGDMHVELGNTELGRAAWGASMPVDPGTVVVRATAPGHRPYEQEVTFEEGKTVTVTIPPLVAEAGGPHAPTPRTKSSEPHDTSASVEPAAGKNVAQANGGTPANADPTAPDATRRTVMYVSGGIGVVGVVAGSAFGLVAISQKRDSDRYCNDGECSESGEKIYETAQLNAMLSNAGFAVGVLGLGTSLYCYLTEPEVEQSGSVAARPAKANGQKPAGATSPLGASVDAGPESVALRVFGAF